jgi:glutaconate CoA-transferase, subunit A
VACQTTVWLLVRCLHCSCRMAQLCALKDAVRELVHDGDSVAAEGFSHLIPFAAGHEIIRQQRRDLTLIRLTPDLIYDQIIGAGCARKMIFSWAGNPGVGLSPRFRDALENGWPRPIEIEEHSHAGLTAAITAGASGLPFGILLGYTGNDLCKHTKTISPMTCPFTGREVMAVKAIRPDVAIIHAQQADRKGNVLLWGVTGIQKEAVLAAKRSIVTVEEICDSLKPMPNSVVLPSWVVTAVVHAPHGARPSYTQGYYSRDDAFYREWDGISKDRNRFVRWVQQNVEHA